MTKKQKALLLVLMAAAMVVLNADGQVMSPKLTSIEAEFGVDDAAVGGMMAFFTVFGAAVSLFLGILRGQGQPEEAFRSVRGDRGSFLRPDGPLRRPGACSSF
jgi:hypothetical protein